MIIVVINELLFSLFTDLTLVSAYPCVCQDALRNVKGEPVCGTDGKLYPTKLVIKCMSQVFLGSYSLFNKVA